VTRSGNLDASIALVTGGTRGIGAAVVRRFVDEGATVVFCGRNPADGTSLLGELGGRRGTASFEVVDAADEQQVTALMADIDRRFGRLDVLVNNAGITLTGTAEATSLADWQEVLRVNLTSVFLVSKLAIPLLRRSDRAAIVNLGSTYGMIGAPGNAAYAASKAAVVNLTKTMALELAADGIRVNALCPGATATPMNVEWLAAQPDPDAALADLVAVHPLGRMARPEEQAAAVLYLASPESSYVTGHALLVDGGRTAR